MRRHLALTAAVLALAACAKSETPAADSPAAAAPPPPAALTNADLAGTWEGQGMPVGKDTVVVTFTMNNSDTGEGTSIVFPSGTKVPSTSRQLSGDSVISESGGFKSQVRRGQDVVSTRMVLRLRDGKLGGMMQAKYKNGDTASYRITATKKAP